SGSACAYFPGKKYTYVRTYDFPKESALLFEGVYRKATIQVDGKPVAYTAYGYSEFKVPIPAGVHTVTVIADNSETPNSRWYSGSGIYRPVWLCVGLSNNVKITTISIAPVAVINITSDSEVSILDNGKLIASGKGNMTIPNAKLWSDESPYLYSWTCKDESGSFGIRKIEWSPKGLFINNKETLLRGGCVHHDNGILGARSYAESEYRRVKILKENGFNAIRSAHNPCSSAMLDACDKLGVYVMDETWDSWYLRKTKFDYALEFEDHYIQDLTSMVEKDFNHPSVIMYSIGNEVSEPATDKGVTLAEDMASILHSLDSTRPVTAGFNLMIIANSAKGKPIYKDGEQVQKQSDMSNMSSTMFNLITSVVGTGMNKTANSAHADKITSPVFKTLDICGYNYASGRYPLEQKAHPERVIVGSETFPQDIAKNWILVKKYPYLIGDFCWTAWDYLGESGLGAWAYAKDGKGFVKPYPWLLADCGVFDILGNPNGELFLAQAAWGLLKNPAISVQPINHKEKPAKMVWRGTNSLPSWSWKGCDNRRAIVEVYSTAPTVELFLNGKSLGTKNLKLCKAVFSVPYHPGTLRAVAYDITKSPVGESRLHSSEEPLSLNVSPEVTQAKPGSIVYVPISISDQSGTLESNADEQLSVLVENGELLAFGSANPRTEESFVSGTYSTYYGRALAVVRTGDPGETMVVAEGKSLGSKIGRIKVKA
ncbi:MAG: DUF4982 domain-containing protein, partial [Clostridiales bacterium]|nr:DUF4982 domain-containing protein [Clostridiales bacterium]